MCLLALWLMHGRLNWQVGVVKLVLVCREGLNELVNLVKLPEELLSLWPFSLGVGTLTGQLWV